MNTTTLTETEPTEPGWYWFLPTGNSPTSMKSRVAVVVLVGLWQPKIKDRNMCVRFPQETHLVVDMGGVWSEKLDEPKAEGNRNG